MIELKVSNFSMRYGADKISFLFCRGLEIAAKSYITNSKEWDKPQRSLASELQSYTLMLW